MITIIVSLILVGYETKGNPGSEEVGVSVFMGVLWPITLGYFIATSFFQFPVWVGKKLREKHEQTRT